MSSEQCIDPTSSPAHIITFQPPREKNFLAVSIMAWAIGFFALTVHFYDIVAVQLGIWQKGQKADLGVEFFVLWGVIGIIFWFVRDQPPYFSIDVQKRMIILGDSQYRHRSPELNYISADTIERIEYKIATDMDAEYDYTISVGTPFIELRTKDQRYIELIRAPFGRRNLVKVLWASLVNVLGSPHSLLLGSEITALRRIAKNYNRSSNTACRWTFGCVTFVILLNIIPIIGLYYGILFWV